MEKITHNFNILNGDTDSLTIYKEQNEEFTQEERTALLNELNSLCPKGLTWEDDGYFHTFIVLKAKNYIMYDPTSKKKPLTIKGSGLKDPKKPKAVLEFFGKMIDCMITEKFNYIEIYNQYVQEILEVKDIRRWASKRTYTEKIDSSERTNETKVKDAIAGTEYKPGDKLYLYFKNDKSLGLVEKFDNDHDIDHLLKVMYDSTKIFWNVVDKSTFINYSLKKNRKLLEINSGV